MVTHRRGFLLKLFLGLILIIGLLQLLKFGADSNLVPQLQQGGRELAALGDLAEQPQPTIKNPPPPPPPTTQPPTETPTKPPPTQERVKQVSN